MASKVTTTIHVDNDTDPFYDNTMAFTYKSISDTPVKIVPTTTGFNVVLVGRQISYDFMEKMYDLPVGSDIEWQKIAVK